MKAVNRQAMNRQEIIQRSLIWLPGWVVFAILLVMPFVLDLYPLVNLTYALIAGLLALSLAWIWGVGGIFSFGQTVFFGLGGYCYGLVSINLGNSLGTLVGLIAGIGLAAISAAGLGGFMFYGRVGSLYVSIITLATTLIFYNLSGSTSGDQYKVGQAALGGFNGMQQIPTLLNLDIPATYWLVLTLATLTLIGLLWLRRSGFGRVFNAVRVNAERTELLGYDIRQIQCLGFAISGAIAGLAGVLHASWGNTISPVVFDINQATLVIIWALVGGRSRLWGAFLGAGLIHFLSTFLSTTAQRTTPLILGSLLIAIVLFLPNGIAPAIEKLWQRIIPSTSATSPRPDDASPSPDQPQNSAFRSPSSLDLQGNRTLHSPRLGNLGDKQPLSIRLETQHLQRKFGSFYAVHDIDLQFEAGKAYCIIGPNGAGKSTYFNLLTGRLQPSAGRILYEGRPIHQLPSHQRSRQGISIKLQVPNVYPELSVYENLWLAARLHFNHPSDWEAAIAHMLQIIGLEEQRMTVAGELSHGQKQWLEIGMAAIAQPKLLLLDEPTGGLSRGETLRTVELLKTLCGYATVIVIEHDMEFVRQFDAKVMVLAQGKVFRTGTIAEIQQDEQVRALYLGNAHA